MKRINVLDVALAIDPQDPPPYDAPFAKVQRLLPAERLGATVIVLEEGKAVCPYHWEAGEEELLVVLEGTPTVRTASGEQVLAPGDVHPFPRGAAGVHRIANAAPEPARLLIVSERQPVSAAVYPDSDKVGVFGADLGLLFRRADARDYYDGER